MSDVEEIVFAVRAPGRDGHWYANFGYWASNEQQMMYGENGGRLSALNLRTGVLRIILDDPAGGIRDPHVHYDGKKILFSYRRGETKSLPPVRNQRRRHRAAATDRRALGRHRADLPARRRHRVLLFALQTLGQVLAHAGGGPATAAMPRRATSASCRATSSRTTRPGCCPTAACSTCGGSTSTAARCSTITCGPCNPDGTGADDLLRQPARRHRDARRQADPRHRNKVVAIFSPGHGRREHAGQGRDRRSEGGPGRPRACPQRRHERCVPRSLPVFRRLPAGGGRRPGPGQHPGADGRGGTYRNHLHARTGPGRFWVHEPRPLRPRRANRSFLRGRTGHSRPAAWCWPT